MHVTGLEPTQAPVWQLSACVHAFPSEQLEPLTLGGLEQTPVPGSHTPGSWHWSGAAQVTGLVPTQAPASHVSDCVHALPSLHVDPLAFGGFEQTPVAVSQTPAS